MMKSPAPAANHATWRSKKNHEEPYVRSDSTDDADNTMTVDNIKVVELAQGIAPLSIVNTNGQIKVYWSDPVNNDGTAMLQSSTNVTGPYLDVPGAASGAASPYVVPVGTPPRFFRSQWVP